MQLRLDAVQDDGTPDECYVSIRLGDVQKLTKLSPSRQFRFPQNVEQRFGKIEVFKRIGTGTIDMSLAEEGQEVKVSSRGCGDMTFKVTTEPEPGKARARAQEEEPGKKVDARVKAAKEYLVHHGLEARLAEAMQHVLHDRPENPAEYMAAWLLRDHLTNPTSPKSAHPVTKPSEPSESTAAPARVQETVKEDATALVPSAASASPEQPKVVSLSAQELVTTWFLKPSVATWVGYPRKLKPEQGQVNLTAYQPVPLKAQPSAAPSPAGPEARSFFLRPSVGTWLMDKPFVVSAAVPQPAPSRVAPVEVPAPPKVQKAATHEVEAPEKGRRNWSMAPSVGTWLNFLI